MRRQANSSISRRAASRPLRRIFGPGSSVLSLTSVMVLVTVPAGIRAQDAAPAAPPAAAGAVAPSPPPVIDVAALAEEISVLRALKSLQATPEQLASLRTAVSAAHERLAQQAQTDMRALAALRDPVTRARQQLLSSNANPNDPQLAAALQVDRQVSEAQQAAARNAERLRDELATSLRRQFGTLLNPAQASTLINQGRAMLAAERSQEEQQRELRRQQLEQARARAQAAGAADPMGRGGRRDRGGPGGDNPERMQRMMEQMRRMDANEYQRMSRGMARRFGDPGTPGHQNALTMFDQVRGMPDTQFRRQRADLARQSAALMSATRSPAGAAYTISPDNAIDAWIRRYLLSPRAPAVLQEIASAQGAPAAVNP